eukprot:TRINITY_DN27695_c0_g1_i1.p2 TRINITY_DN27695_c0_g1~~TRINITY_DN27695_c0_g1_i1.p2  ORF type:complete len:116 (-),score=41.35 TRINITY_DN27695_c0_g1_i1:13-360(-)
MAAGVGRTGAAATDPANGGRGASTMLPLPQTPLLLLNTHMTATSAAAIAAEVASRDDELVDALDAHMGLPFAQVIELHNAAGRAVLHLQASTAMMAIMMATRAGEPNFLDRTPAN